MKSAITGSAPSGAYSPGILAEGRFLFVSGQGPLRDGAVVGDDIETQTHVTLDNVRAVLAAAGLTMADVVRCGVFMADLADFDRMDAVYREHFPDPLPARTTIGSGLQDILVEIDCVAVAPTDD
ncbi:RidA family protein [Occultella gossypii]|uniref:RidA family protein n=1 Tax=Occultella gossypii TaxID=2800820 RepID=A0ABS7S6D2_9MICO|nr:RidA family protein [Occultella gossypii]MBZ2194738.1 RidA family protein [Occultella gossypii]